MKKAICVALLLVGGTANAAVIDFNSNPDYSYWNTPVYSGGFTFSDVTGQGSLGTASNLDGQSTSNGTVHLMDWTNYGSLSSVKMQATDGSLFSVNTFDFTSGYLNGSSIANRLDVYGYDSSGNLVANSSFSTADYTNTSFSTLDLGSAFQNLSYVLFSATGSYNRVGYDNIVVNEPASVPEPSSLALLGLGLAGLGFARKKKS